MAHIGLKIWARHAVVILILAGLLRVDFASGDDISELKEQMSSFDDPKETAQDLAFYLSTHDYDARPVDGYVEIRLSSTVYKLVPNGDRPGLADILPANESMN